MTGAAGHQSWADDMISSSCGLTCEVERAVIPTLRVLRGLSEKIH